MARLSGRCPRGERLVGRVPHGHWKTITFVGALRCQAAPTGQLALRPGWNEWRNLWLQGFAW
jgi:hypothetical protein